MEALTGYLGLLHSLDYNIMFMLHDLLLPQMKYQTVIQRKGKRVIAHSQQRKT